MLARLRTGRPGPTVALRADIDALPIRRRAASSSRPSGRARCTRAGTTGTPRCCSARRRTLAHGRLPGGELRFIFQHGEELAPGGARELIDAGVMEGVDFVYGCHLWTPLEYGKVAAVPGDFMAAADFFRLTITGSGGHAGLPHTAIDTIACRGGARRLACSTSSRAGSTRCSPRS